jgi:hypothetical protein
MNAEKELLLALLIEKYTAPKAITPDLQKPDKAVRKHVKRRPYKIHRWTASQKEDLMMLRDVDKLDFDYIARVLNLRTEQVKSMYSLTSRQNAQQVQNVL